MQCAGGFSLDVKDHHHQRNFWHSHGKGLRNNYVADVLMQFHVGRRQCLVAPERREQVDRQMATIDLQSSYV
jgi:hypothetical protein